MMYRVSGLDSRVNDDKSVSGSVTTTGIKAIAAHIHEAAAGKNDPVAIPLEKKSDNVRAPKKPGNSPEL